jgi:8-oxo-dGTP diphosphatase
LESDGSILLIKHDRIGPDGFLWSPPGGGVEFGYSVEQTLIKEFKEETNLDIEIQSFLFVNEYIDVKHHAIELFFTVKFLSGFLKLGSDPEIPANEQILSEIRFIDYNELKLMKKTTVHNCFGLLKHPRDVFELRGFFKFENI